VLAATPTRTPLGIRLAWIWGSALTCLAIVGASALADDAGAAKRGRQAHSAGDHKAKRAGRHSGRRATRAARRKRWRRARARRAHLRLRVSRNVALGQRRRIDAGSSDGAALDASFEEGLLNWNTAGVGESIPSVVTDQVRDGARSGRFLLTGSQHRSELILGGNGGGSTNGMVEFHEGAEYWYAFSFYIQSMVYGRPGAHNLIMQFKGDDDGSPAFGLQLWDYEGDDDEYEDNPRGLWSHGPSMGGDRFLALAPERTWHDVVIHFRASSTGAGYYEVYLDGRLVDSRNGVSMIADGAGYAYIKNGLYRNGGTIPGTSEIRLDAARLGPSLSSVSPS
jgi:hypothetical protein